MSYEVYVPKLLIHASLLDQAGSFIDSQSGQPSHDHSAWPQGHSDTDHCTGCVGACLLPPIRASAYFLHQRLVEGGPLFQLLKQYIYHRGSAGRRSTAT